MNRNQICICLVVVSSLDFAFNAACQDRARYLNRDGFATIKGDSGSKNAAESKDTPEAAEAFRKFESAGKFFDRADFKSAVDACTQAITLNPKLEAAYSLRGDALFALGETKLAFEDLNKAVRIGSSSRSFSSRGFVYHELNQLKEALSDFNAAIKMDKTNSFALAYRGDTFRKMKEFDKAIADLTQSIAVGPIDASQFELRALAYLENRQYALAIPDYKAAIALNPKSSSAHIGRAYAFVKQEKYGDAI